MCRGSIEPGMTGSFFSGPPVGNSTDLETPSVRDRDSQLVKPEFVETPLVSETLNP